MGAAKLTVNYESAIIPFSFYPATVLSGSAPSLPQEVPENEEREGCEQVDNETREREGVTPHPSKSGGVGGKTTKRKGRGQTLKRRRNSEGTGRRVIWLHNEMTGEVYIYIYIVI